mgnify:CR=1 FL=1
MCAALVAAGLADAVVSSDVDALLFGAPRQYRECRMQVRGGRGEGGRVNSLFSKKGWGWGVLG